MTTLAATTLAAERVPPTREELRRLIRAIEARPPSAPRPAALPRPLALEAMPGDWRRLDGSLITREETLPPGYVHGTQPLALGMVPPDLLALLAGTEDLAGADVRDLLFLDIETTGLGGAGAMVFLVTIGHAASDGFVLRQYLAGSPADEAALLTRLGADIRATHPHPVLVTYNGRTFDIPMLDQRATMHRLRGAFDAMPHLDLLYAVRRGFRGVLTSCRLAHIEATLLGVTRPADEVSGGDVPAWYFRFLRGGDARHLVPLAAHNAVDVISLAALVARLAGVAAGAGSGIEQLALGRLQLAAGDRAAARSHPAAGDRAAARPHFEHAAALLRPSLARDECLFALAALHRRDGRPEAAAALWREIARRPGAPVARALVELAKYEEHVAHDAAAALVAVDQAIAAVGEDAALARRRSRLLGRLARASV